MEGLNDLIVSAPPSIAEDSAPSTSNLIKDTTLRRERPSMVTVSICVSPGLSMLVPLPRFLSVYAKPSLSDINACIYSMGIKEDKEEVFSQKKTAGTPLLYMHVVTQMQGWR